MSKSKAGRKGKYHKWLTEEGLTQIRGWAMDGLTQADMAHNMGVGYSTFYEWQARFPELREAVNKSREVADREVENALFRNATGYEYEETKIIKEEVDGKERVRVEKIKKHMQPHTTAQIFWLKNRRPANWRDVHKLEHSGSIDFDDDIKEIEERLENDKEGREAIKRIFLGSTAVQDADGPSTD